MSVAIANEETLVIETPERVPLHFALASTGNRFLACAVDHGLQLFTMLLVGLVFMWMGYWTQLGSSVSQMPQWLLAALIILMFALWTGYFAIFEWLWNGQTPGKRMLKLRVIREDGRPVTAWDAAARNLLRVLDMMPWVGIPFYSVGLISVFASSRDQRIGDFVAGTVVVREREAQAPTFAAVFDSPTSDVALRRSFKPVMFSGDTGALTEREMEVVEIFLRRRWELTEATRQWMAWRVATPILYKLKPGFDRETFTYEGFLEELLHRYRAAHRFTD